MRDIRVCRGSLLTVPGARLSQEELDAVAKAAEKRCIIAATLHKAGIPMSIALKKA